MSLVLFVLVCYGMTSILTWGKIFDKIRPNYSFFHCSQCVGTWVGFVVFFAFWFGGVKFFNLYYGWFLMGCLSGGTSYMLDSLFKDNGLQINIETKSLE